MKQSLLVAALLALTLSACGKKEEPVADAAPAPAPMEQSAPAPVEDAVQVQPTAAPAGEPASESAEQSAPAMEGTALTEQEPAPVEEAGEEAKQGEGAAH